MNEPAFGLKMKESAPFLTVDQLVPMPPVLDVVGLVRNPALRATEILGVSRSSKWQRRNPGARFSDYYASRVASKLARGAIHRTLGKTSWPTRKLELQKRRVELLRHWGLKSHHRFIDYGCGSLRIGQHFIRFLNPGSYVGLDVTETFFQVGIELLGEELIQEKRPDFLVIDSDTICDLEQDPPDFLVSTAVLHHVHPSELDAYLTNIIRLTGANTQAFVSFREWTKVIRIAEKSWAHPAQDLVERIVALDRSVEVTVQQGASRNRRWDPSRKSMLRLTRRPPRWGSPKSLT